MFKTVVQHVAESGAGIHEPAGSSPAGSCRPSDWSYRGGHILHYPRVYNVYWGTPPYPTSQLEDATRQLVEGGYLSTTQVTGEGGNLGHFMGGIHLPDAPPSSAVADFSIGTLLTSRIADGTLPRPDWYTIYQIFLPSGTSVTLNGVSSCAQFCAYHSVLPDLIGFYSVIPDNNCQGCIGPNDKWSVYTAIMGHEITEAVSDPQPGTGWYSDQCGENADICAWQFLPYGSITVQPMWSGSSCASGPFTNAAAPPSHPVATTFSFNWDAGTATGGTPLNVNISAMGPDNATLSNQVQDVGFGAQGDFIHFTSSDPRAVLPPDLQMSYADHGNHIFSVIFNTGGNQTITATSTLHPDITGTSTAVAVTQLGVPVARTAKMPVEFTFGRLHVGQHAFLSVEVVPRIPVNSSVDLSVETLSPRHRMLPAATAAFVFETTKEVRKISIPG